MRHGIATSRERGSSRQRQALDVVIQVDNQRMTNIKQKFAAKFDPIDLGGAEWSEYLHPLGCANRPRG